MTSPSQKLDPLHWSGFFFTRTPSSRSFRSGAASWNETSLSLRLALPGQRQRSWKVLCLSKIEDPDLIAF